MIAPVNDLLVRIMGVFGTEWRPPDQTFEHDGTDGPPIAAEAVAMSCEDLRSNVIRRSDGRVSQGAAGLAPSVDRLVITHRQVDLVEGDGVAVLLLPLLIRGIAAVQELLVVRIGVGFAETGRKTKVGELNMAIPVKQDVVWFDVSVDVSMAVDFFEGTDDFRHIETGHG